MTPIQGVRGPRGFNGTTGPRGPSGSSFNISTCTLNKAETTGRVTVRSWEDTPKVKFDFVVSFLFSYII